MKKTKPLISKEELLACIDRAEHPKLYESEYAVLKCLIINLIESKYGKVTNTI